jgi:hypothetical protein
MHIASFAAVDSSISVQEAPWHNSSRGKLNMNLVSGFRRKGGKNFLADLSYLFVTRITARGAGAALLLANATPVVRYAVRPQAVSMINEKSRP